MNEPRRPTEDGPLASPRPPGVASAAPAEPKSAATITSLAAALVAPARQLLAHPSADEREGPARAAVEALDGFLAAPAPSTFLAALRKMERWRRQLRLGACAAPVWARSFVEGSRALAAVEGLPPPLVHFLTRALPLDGRAGMRLRALATLASVQQELDGRVAADLQARRRLWKPVPARRARSAR